MTFDQFIKAYNNRFLDFDGYYGGQCMDLAQFYNRDVIGAPRMYGNAINQWSGYNSKIYKRFPNTAGAVPMKGDIMIWGKGVGRFGHIAVFYSGNGKTFVSFDQNFPIGSRCHLQAHDYSGVLGWLRKIAIQPPDVITDDEIKFYFTKIFGRLPAYGDWYYWRVRLNAANPPLKIIGEADMLSKMEHWSNQPDGAWQEEKNKVIPKQ